MKVLALAVLCALALAASGSHQLPETVYRDLFKGFVRTHSKTYADDEEFEMRYNIFQSNYDRIVKHNTNNTHTFTLGLTPFADWTNEEYRMKLLSTKMPYRTPSANVHKAPVDTSDLPASVDWRNKGVVTPVKNQGQCGSCWAFSTTGSVEGALALKTGNLVSYSEQQLVDCSSSFGNMGCNGGLMDNAFQYIEKNGLEPENDYQYQAITGSCQYNQQEATGHISGYTDVEQSASALQSAAAQQPVSVAINAAGYEFQLYSGGVFNPASCPNAPSDLDHGVLVAGYGNLNGQDYWLVKNSWGASWGDQGYIMMARGNNLCGIQDSASYPTA